MDFFLGVQLHFTIDQEIFPFQYGLFCRAYFADTIQKTNDV